MLSSTILVCYSRFTGSRKLSSRIVLIGLSHKFTCNKSLREHVSLREHACVSSRGAQSTELVSLYIGYWTLNNYYYYYYWGGGGAVHLNKWGRSCGSIPQSGQLEESVYFSRFFKEFKSLQCLERSCDRVARCRLNRKVSSLLIGGG